MTWTATVLGSIVSGDFVETSVVLSDGVSQKFVQSFSHDGSLGSLTNLCIAATTMQPTIINNVKAIPPGTVIDLTPPAVVTPPPPTPQQLAQQAWLVQYAQTQALERGLAVGVVQQSDVDTAKANLAKAWDPSYVAVL